MLHLDLILPCHLITINQSGSHSSFFKVCDSLELKLSSGEKLNDEIPSVQMSVMTLWRLSTKDDCGREFLQVLTIIYPNGSKTDLAHTLFVAEGNRFFLQVQLPHFEIHHPGIYTLRAALRSPSCPDDMCKWDYPIKVKMGPYVRCVELAESDIELLHRPITGQGGFQSFLKRLSSQLRGRLLYLCEEDVRRLRQYAAGYGGGGFQGRLEPLLKRILADFKG